MKKDYISLMLLNYGNKEFSEDENKEINLINFGFDNDNKESDKENND